MAQQTRRAISGHVFKRDGKRGGVWYAKYRLPDGRQVQTRIGPHWSGRKQAPPAGSYTKASARAWLDDTLAKARRGELPGMVRTGTTFAAACDEWLAYKRDRKVKLSTQIDYEHMVDRMKKVFGEKFGARMKLEDVTPEMVEGFRDALIAEDLADRTVNKYLTVLHGLFVWAQRRHKLPANPVANVERRPHAKRGNIDVFSREEVLALVRAAASEQDGTVYLTAAFTGLRLGELLALRWRDVDFANSAIHVRQSFTNGRVDTPKSGQERVVPMADEVAEALAKLGKRESHAGADDLVFCGAKGGHLAGHKLRDRYKTALEKAGLRELRFHDLRHTFGTHAIRAADSREVMEWMGHQDLATTQRYLQFKPRQDAARRISEAFRDSGATEVTDPVG
ncbi:MAG TPA: tyrosine-type recombinase/integrase [Solirubrobacterales bacterium]|jgi:integrase